MSEHRPPQAPRSLFSNPWLLGAAAGVLLLGLVCVAALVVAGVLALTRGAGRAPEAEVVAVAPPRSLNRIVYVDPNGRLHTIDADGGNGRQLSQDGLNYQFPAWSPDGNHIAAIGAGSAGVGVYVFADEDQAEPTQLYHGQQQAPFYLYWSPDSAWVSFLSNVPGSLGLWLAPRQGESPTAAVAQGQPFYWEWGQGSDELFIHTGGSAAGARLTFLDLQGQGGDADLARPGPFQAPGISAGGEYLAFSEPVQGAASQVVVQRRDGLQRWMAPHRGAAAMSWSPATEQLAFIHPAQPAATFFGPLHLLDAASGETRQLSGRLVVAFFWSPDGRSIAAFTPHDADSGGGAGLQAPPAAGRPQGRLLLDLWAVDVSSGEERLLTSFQPTPLFVGQFLPFFDQYALSHRLWSATSDALILPARDEQNNEQLYIIPTDGSPPHAIAPGRIGFWTHQ